MASYVSRLGSSYAAQQQLFEERVAAGRQPAMPATSTSFLLWANIGYLTLTFLLYAYMSRREQPFRCKPFKTILLVYNFLCVLLAGYVVWGIVTVLTSSPGHRFVCNPTVTPGSAEDDGNAAFMAKVFWVFYAQKFWEFLDTLFFILRKSFRQVTFLHVFHHCSINIVVGLILPFEFNGDMYLPILLNATVHVLMYTHYLVSALGMSTPWKAYLTSMQLVQFVCIATQSGISLYRGDSCGAPYFGKILMVAYMSSMLLLFGNFFLRAYVLKKPSTKFGDGVVKRFDGVQITKTHSGRVILDSEGEARVELPPAFSSGELTYQLTAIGRPMPNLHVAREPSPEACSLTLAGGVHGQAASWTVTRQMTVLGEKQKPKPALLCCGDTATVAAENGQEAPSAAFCCMSPHATSDKKAQ
jgi:elongation of very long chain fatty acids protein 4